MKRFWTYIRHQREAASGVPALKVKGRLITDAREKAQALNKQFDTAFSEGSKVYTDEKIKTKCTTPDSGGFHPPMPENLTTTLGIERLFRKLNPAKVAGPDGITPRVLRELAVELAPPLTRKAQTPTSKLFLPCPSLK